MRLPSHIVTLPALLGFMILFARIACPGAPEPGAVGWTGTLYAMGGVPVEFLVLDQETKIDRGRFLDHAAAAIDRLEDQLSTWRPESLISRWNRAAPTEAVALGQAGDEVVREGMRIFTETDGAYDISVGALVRLWRTAGERGAAPTDAEIAAARNGIGADAIGATATGFTRGRAGIEIILDGLAKGYIVDRAADLLRDRGVRRGMVNAGGDLRTIVAPGAAPIRIGIRDPDGGPERILGSFALGDAAIATSGNYERFLEIGARRYGHIIDPRTGQPAEGCASVTVMAASAMRADGLATGLFVLGPDRGIEVVESLPGVEAAILWRDGDRLRRRLSSGFPAVEWGEPIAGWSD